MPEKKVLLPTVPVSPAFALKNRVRVDKVSLHSLTDTVTFLSIK